MDKREARHLRIVEGDTEHRSIYGMQANPYLTIFADGRADIPQTHGKLVVWSEDKQSIVLKEQGHSEYWNQYNPPFKVPTQLHVFLKLADGTVIAVTTTPIRKQDT